MKPTSPLSLLLFLSLTTAAPIPKNCLHYTVCTPWLREIFSSSPSSLNDLKSSLRSSLHGLKNDHTPPTRLPTPHFPAHQVLPPSASAESHREIEAEFNNAPLTPPSSQAPSIVLSGLRPIQSSYLLSLTNPALANPPQAEPSSTSPALPSKPTSALPKLREEDKLRYWATITSDHSNEVQMKEGEEVAISERPVYLPKCLGGKGKWAGVGQPMAMAREYSDLLVVGIVVLFLAGVVILEAVEYCVDLRSAIFGKRRQRRGEIYLEEDEGVEWALKKPFSLNPAPAGKWKNPLRPVREVEVDEEKGEEYFHDFKAGHL